MSIWKAIGKSISVGSKISSRLSNGIANSANNVQNKTSFKAKKAGYILAGDKIGYDLAGLNDYSSLLLPNQLNSVDLSRLSNGSMTLGNMYNPRKPDNKYSFSIYDSDVFQHSLLIAPSGSGKTYGVIIPAMYSLLEKGYRVVANDVKGDLISQLQAYKSSISSNLKFPLFIWNPFDSGNTKCWNPLNEISSINDDTMIRNIVDAIIGSDSSQGPQNSHFVERDKRWLSGLIKLIKKEKSNATLSDIYHLVNNQVNLEAKINLQSAPIISGLNDLADSNNAHFVAGLANKLSIFGRSEVSFATSRSDFTIDYIIKNPGLIIIGSPLYEGDEAFKAASIFFSVMRAKIYKNGSLNISNCWLIDEAGEIAPRLEMYRDFATLRSYNVGIFLSIQELMQLGKDEYKKYVANCANKILLNGVDFESAEFFSKTLGNKQVVQTTKSIDYRNKSTWSHGNQTVSVLGTTEIMHYPREFGTHSGIFFNQNIINSPILLDFSRKV